MTPTTPTPIRRRRTREEDAASVRRAAASVMPGIALVLQADERREQDFEAALARFLAAAQAKVDARFAQYPNQGGGGPKYVRDGRASSGRTRAPASTTPTTARAASPGTAWSTCAVNPPGAAPQPVAAPRARHGPRGVERTP